MDESAVGRLRLTDAGNALLEAMYALTTDVVAGLWAGHEHRFDLLNDLVGRALAAAAETGGPASAVLAPAYEPSGAPDGMILAERLTPLRFHRFDAHVAAWRAAGLTAAEARALPDGPAKDAIEADTSRRSAPAYAALTPNERVELLAGLGALPN